MANDITTDLGRLAQNGVLRVAINTGNRALVQQNGEELDGVSPALARLLAHHIKARMVPIIYKGAGKVFEDEDKDVWDVGFLAIDPLRAQKVSFTRAYVTIEATYAVRASSAIMDLGDVDVNGVTVLTAKGSAYDMHLSKSLENATLDRFGTPPDSFSAFRAGRADIVAGVRASLQQEFDGDPAFRILKGTLTKVSQAMVLPGRNNPSIGALDEFLQAAIKDGFVRSALADTADSGGV